jgi:hypothetical protein
MTSLRVAGLGFALLSLAGTTASAQTIAAAPTTATAAKPAIAAAPSASGKKAVVPANCMRLPLSDVAFGTENATAAARAKQQEYAEAEAKKRKWPLTKPMVKSNETVSCTVYLNLGPLGTEYRCLVTTTFCQK